MTQNTVINTNSNIDSQIEYIHSSSFPELLQQLGISLLVSTYQAGKLMAIRAKNNRLTTLLRNFQQVKGIALSSQQLAIGVLNSIWFFRNISEIIPLLETPNDYDACFIPLSSQTTGDIQVHEIAWVEEKLWIVNTRFSCLCTLDPYYSFVPCWQPSFITALKNEDRCHLNGLALVDGQIKYVTALGETDHAQGWRENKAKGGCLIEFPTSEIVARGLCMPHSPRFYDGKLWLLDSGNGHLLVVDLDKGSSTVVVELPGFTRGLAFHDRYAFIGLSQIREKKIFSGLPIEEKFSKLQCGVCIIDIKTGKPVGSLEFQSGCTELFDVQVFPNFRQPTIIGFQKDTINNIFVTKGFTELPQNIQIE